MRYVRFLNGTYKVTFRQGIRCTDILVGSIHWHSLTPFVKKIGVCNIKILLEGHSSLRVHKSGESCIERAVGMDCQLKLGRLALDKRMIYLAIGFEIGKILCGLHE